MTARARRMPTMRIRVAATGLDGKPTSWRVISGMGPMLRTHGTFATREEAVKFVLELLRIGRREAVTTPGETHGSIR
jgi:hypothetical protein